MAGKAVCVVLDPWLLRRSLDVEVVGGMKKDWDVLGG